MNRYIYLIPGFFGFDNFGDLKYFAHVRDQIQTVLRKHGKQAEIHYVDTLPTASLRHRTMRLLDKIASTAVDQKAPIHLVGHSTGGLDARLLTSANVYLSSPHNVDQWVTRIRSVVTISSPHFGSPLAGFFISMLGQKILRVLSLVTIHTIRLGSIPLPALVALASILPSAPAVAIQGPTLSLLDQVYQQILKDFDRNRRQDLELFFGAAAADQALLPQLTPESMDIFNIVSRTHDDVRYGCVVTRARPPRLRGMLSVGISPLGQAMYGLYRALYRIVSSFPEHALPPLTTAQSAALRLGFGSLPSAADNDAIVPTRSQIWGDVVHAAWSDHLDSIGHFAEPRHKPPHVDWLGTLSGFRRRHFEALWSDVVTYLLAGE